MHYLVFPLLLLLLLLLLLFNSLQVIVREKLLQDPIQMKLLACSWLNGVRKIAVLHSTELPGCAVSSQGIS